MKTFTPSRQVSYRGIYFVYIIVLHVRNELICNAGNNTVIVKIPAMTSTSKT